MWGDIIKSVPEVEDAMKGKTTFTHLNNGDMTFREFMRENGYELQTTFWSDFSIADSFGLPAVRDTFRRAFEEWKGNYKYLTELVLVLNHKIWQYHETRPEFASLYQSLWEQADQYAAENLKDDELGYFLDTTD